MGAVVGRWQLMAHIGDLLVLLGLVLAFPAGVAVGWWARGRRRKPVA